MINDGLKHNLEDISISVVAGQGTGVYKFTSLDSNMVSAKISFKDAEFNGITFENLKRPAADHWESDALQNTKFESCKFTGDIDLSGASVDVESAPPKFEDCEFQNATHDDAVEGTLAGAKMFRTCYRDDDNNAQYDIALRLLAEPIIEGVYPGIVTENEDTNASGSKVKGTVVLTDADGWKAKMEESFPKPPGAADYGSLWTELYTVVIALATAIDPTANGTALEVDAAKVLPAFHDGDAAVKANNQKRRAVFEDMAARNAPGVNAQSNNKTVVFDRCDMSNAQLETVENMSFNNCKLVDSKVTGSCGLAQFNASNMTNMEMNPSNLYATRIEACEITNMDVKPGNCSSYGCHAVSIRNCYITNTATITNAAQRPKFFDEPTSNDAKMIAHRKSTNAGTQMSATYGSATPNGWVVEVLPNDRLISMNLEGLEVEDLELESDVVQSQGPILGRSNCKNFSMKNCVLLGNMTYTLELEGVAVEEDKVNNVDEVRAGDAVATAVDNTAQIATVGVLNQENYLSNINIENCRSLDNNATFAIKLATKSINSEAYDYNASGTAGERKAIERLLVAAAGLEDKTFTEILESDALRPRFRRYDYERGVDIAEIIGTQAAADNTNNSSALGQMIIRALAPIALPQAVRMMSGKAISGNGDANKLPTNMQLDTDNQQTDGWRKTDMNYEGTNLTASGMAFSEKEQLFVKANVDKLLEELQDNNVTSKIRAYNEMVARGENDENVKNALGTALDRAAWLAEDQLFGYENPASNAIPQVEVKFISVSSTDEQYLRTETHLKQNIAGTDTAKRSMYNGAWGVPSMNFKGAILNSLELSNVSLGNNITWPTNDDKAIYEVDSDTSLLNNVFIENQDYEVVTGVYNV